jgi:hypothetical protein
VLNKESQGIHADQEKIWSVAPPSAESISQQATTSDSRDSRICRAAGFRRGCFLWVIESLSARLRRSALRPGQPLGSAEITHAFHPVRGQRFVVLEIKEVSGVEILSLRRSEMGSLCCPPRMDADEAERTKVPRCGGRSSNRPGSKPRPERSNDVGASPMPPCRWSRS